MTLINCNMERNGVEEGMGGKERRERRLGVERERGLDTWSDKKDRKPYVFTTGRP